VTSVHDIAQINFTMSFNDSIYFIDSSPEAQKKERKKHIRIK
jgi:hypothetical protein